MTATIGRTGRRRCARPNAPQDEGGQTKKAKLLSVDMSPAGAQAEISLINRSPSGRRRAGTGACDIADPETAVERGLQNPTSYGPWELLLEAPDVSEIMTNAPEGTF